MSEFACIACGVVSCENPMPGMKCRDCAGRAAHLAVSSTARVDAVNVNGKSAKPAGYVPLEDGETSHDVGALVLHAPVIPNPKRPKRSVGAGEE